MSSGPGADSAPAPHDTRKKTAPGEREGRAERPARTSMFSSLRIRNYRLFAMGQLVSNTGTWMQRIAQDWLVHSLTGSATAVGLTVALQFLPMLLFGLYGGVLADRCAKRRLLLITQATMGLTGLALAALTLSGSVQVWHVYALAFALGLVTVVDNPARQTFVAEMVGPAQLRNAVSLNSANFQSARLVGPAVAGVLITAVGSGWAFLLNGLSFLAPITGLLLMRASELHSSKPVRRGKGQLREGLAYVRGKPELMWPIVLVGFIGTFGFNFPIWLTAFTERVFDQGAATYGLLNVLMAAGSVTGALLAARRASSRMRLLVGAAALFGLLLSAAALTPWFWLFAALMVAVGLMGLTFNVTANSSVQLATDPVMRGRVMSLFMMVFVGGTPIGGPLMGWVTDVYGPRIGLLAGGGIALLAAVLVALALARAAGLRLRLDLRRGSRGLSFVPREPLPVSPLASPASPAQAAEAAEAADGPAPEADPGDGPRADGPQNRAAREAVPGGTR
ncbi:MFS transporter [Streptomyces sp. TRM 70351]|uniref:MFS transporter n=1 Tax=Streptomyces sp. TRM 70351 TaxID=3116552 RepID=UPI002E7B79B6|nr:MFS transporter [Streptomyces sp. TRM 70351]MEE1929602.1 MFS transporter [Streptomyces sp. TRM 70351]